MTNQPPGKFVYTDDPHAYHVGGRKAPGASTTAKIVADTFLIEKYGKRQVAIGVALDPTIQENIACHLDNDARVNAFVEDALKVAGAHRKADRGTQAHRSLQMVLLGLTDQLLTAQQHADARALQNTLDRYGLEPTEYVERFIFYPQSRLCGRFDAILRNRAGELVMTDLKTGLNAVRYPHTTCVQLAFYRNAPWVSTTVEVDGNRTTVLEWGKLPEMRDDIGYVLQLEPDADVGELYELNIKHGWAGAKLALDVRDWRSEFSWGDDLVKLVTAASYGSGNGPAAPGWRELVEGAQTLTALRLIYATARDHGALTPALRGMFMQKSQQLPKGS
jgi:hypothetical protein